MKLKRRQEKKLKRRLLLNNLLSCVKELDENGLYNVSVQRLFFSEHKTIKIINNYRIEIRSREGHHNYAHFHVVQGKEGMASIRIDIPEVIKSTLPQKELKKILEWASKNRDVLVNVWNEFHGHRILIE